jgi:putative peptidoglycan lipid II flippase
MSDSPNTISRSAAHFLSGTFLSRISGLLRDVTMACCFGACAEVAAFMVAYRLAHLMRRLFGESSIPGSFIPYFEQTRKEDPAESARLFRDLLASLGFLLIALIVVLEGGMWWLSRSNLLSIGGIEIADLMMRMMPGVLFVCLFGVSSALMQSEKKFFLSAFAPVAFNCVWIAAAFAWRDLPKDEAMQKMSLAIIAAFLAQWVFTMPFLGKFFKKSFNLRELFRFRLFSTPIRTVMSSLFLSVIGIGAVQINSALDAVFARYASAEGPAYLWYAIRLQQVPLALFGIALSSALLPPLARAFQNEGKEAMCSLTAFAMRRSFTLIFPCMLLLIVGGASGVNLIYGRGGFDAQAASETVVCLWAYSLGLIPAVFVLILAPAFYAQKDFKTPMHASLLSVGCNTLLNVVFIFGLGWGAFSVALATSASAFVNFFYLYRSLVRKSGPIMHRESVSPLAKIALCTFIGAAGAFLVGSFLLNDPTWDILMGKTSVAFIHGFFDQAVALFVMGGLFLVLFFSYAWMINAADILELVPLRFRRKVQT